MPQKPYAAQPHAPEYLKSTSTRYTAVLDEINPAHQSFYSHFDEAMECASFVSNAIQNPG
jgi:hypothetical protein